MKKKGNALDSWQLIIDLIVFGMFLSKINEKCSVVIPAIWVLIAFLAHLRIKLNDMEGEK